jgi:flavodoxin
MRVAVFCLPHEGMKVALLYGSSHGRTRNVVERSLQQLKLTPEVFDVKDRPLAEKLTSYDILLFFSPTYGDEELQPDMEDFIRQFSLDLRRKYFAICELGNYYGHDDFSFGAMPILRRCLLELGGKELCSPLSLDSMPRVNWEQLNRWIGHVNRSLDCYAVR